MGPSIATFLNRLWGSDEVLAVIVAAILSLIGWILVRIFLPRGKVAWGVSHQHAFLLQNQQPPTLVYTKEIWIQNVGLGPVQKIEIIFAAAPNHIDIWPQRNFSQIKNPNGNLVITIDNLNRREYFTISMLNIAADTPMVTNVRWSGGIGKQRQMAPQQVFSRSFVNTMRIMLLIGVFSLFYYLVRVILIFV